MIYGVPQAYHSMEDVVVKMEQSVDEQIEMSRKKSTCEVGDDFVLTRFKKVLCSKMCHERVDLVRLGNLWSHILRILTLYFLPSFYLSVNSITGNDLNRFKCSSYTNRYLGLVQALHACFESPQIWPFIHPDAFWLGKN